MALFRKTPTQIIKDEVNKILSLNPNNQNTIERERRKLMEKYPLSQLKELELSIAKGISTKNIEKAQKDAEIVKFLNSLYNEKNKELNTQLSKVNQSVSRYRQSNTLPPSPRSPSSRSQKESISQTEQQILELQRRNSDLQRSNSKASSPKEIEPQNFQAELPKPPQIPTAPKVSAKMPPPPSIILSRSLLADITKGKELKNPEPKVSQSQRSTLKPQSLLDQIKQGAKLKNAAERVIVEPEPKKPDLFAQIRQGKELKSTEIEERPKPQRMQLSQNQLSDELANAIKNRNKSDLKNLSEEEKSDRSAPQTKEAPKIVQPSVATQAFSSQKANAMMAKYHANAQAAIQQSASQGFKEVQDSEWDDDDHSLSNIRKVLQNNGAQITSDKTNSPPSTPKVNSPHKDKDQGHER